MRWCEGGVEEGGHSQTQMRGVQHKLDVTKRIQMEGIQPISMFRPRSPSCGHGQTSLLPGVEPTWRSPYCWMLTHLLLMSGPIAWRFHPIIGVGAPPLYEWTNLLTIFPLLGAITQWIHWVKSFSLLFLSNLSHVEELVLASLRPTHSRSFHICETIGYVSPITVPWSTL